MDILELIHIENQQNQCKPHKCTMESCNKAFGNKGREPKKNAFINKSRLGRRSDLARHLRIHTNERYCALHNAPFPILFTHHHFTIVDLMYVKNLDVEKVSFSVQHSKFTSEHTLAKDLMYVNLKTVRRTLAIVHL